MSLNPRVPLAILTTLVLASCSKGDDTEQEYCDPTAIAGVDQSVMLGDTTVLDGSLSQSCMGLSLAHTWTFEQVPVGSALDDAAFGAANGTSSAASVEFLPDAVGSYVISLTVNDGVTTSNPDLVVISVSTSNLPPVADAGLDQSGQVGQRISFDGSSSNDPEGEELEYLWTLAQRPSGSTVDSTDIYDSTTGMPSIVPDKAGVYVLQLVVSDGTSWSTPDFVSATVAAENQPPIADAGTSQTLAPCDGSTVELNGYGSFDADGDPLTYQWSLTSAPSGSAASDDDFDDPTLPNPRFTWDITGSYTFSLQVHDGKNWSATDIVTLTMSDASANRTPVANAGDNEVIEADTECSSSSYVWTCPPCDAVSTAIDASGSADPNGDSLSFQWTQVGDTSAGTATIASQYTAWTQVDLPATSTEYGTTTSNVFEFQVEVADCSESATDTVQVTVQCTGERP